MLNRARLWVRSIFLRRRLEREMREEMGEHLERATARLRARGLSEKEARRQATREFGNLPYLQEAARDARGGRWLETLAMDSRFALRHFGRKPGATVTMLVVLSMGLTISTSLFSFLHSYSVQPPPGIPRSGDLVRIRGEQSNPQGVGTRRFTRDELRQYQELTGPFRAVAGWADDQVMLEAEGGEAREALWATGTFVTENYFDVLEVRPALGPGLSPGTSTDAGALTAVIGHSVWDRLFGRSPGVIGETLVVNGVPVTIVGVAPPRFGGVTMLTRFKVWLPLPARALLVPELDPGAEAFGAAARIRPGVSPAAATTPVRVVAARAAAELERTSDDPFERERTSEVVPLVGASGDPNFDRDVRMMTLAFGTLGLLVLLVTCTNVSALQTGLGMARGQEIAIRLSLGAGRPRIVQQLLTESVLLAAGAAGAALAIVGLLQHMATTRVPDMPFVVVLNGPATAFTFFVALAAGVLFGLSPALHATRLTVGSALKDSAGAIAAPRARLQRGLVVAQVAFTQPLVVALAAMMLLLVGASQRQALNESADRIISLRLTPALAAPALRGGDTASTRPRSAELLGLRDRLEATPGLAAAVADPRYSVTLEGYTVHPEDRVAGGLAGALRLSGPTVAPGYFAVLGIPVMVGRPLAPTDPGFSRESGGAPVPVVIESDLARALWPGTNPIGRRLQPPAESAGGAQLAVVGVTERPVAAEGPGDDRYRVYLAADSARSASALALLIRTSGEAAPLMPMIRSVVREELPRMVVSEMRTLADIEADTRQIYVIATGVLGIAGALALLLSAIGLYAVVAFSVGQRTGEIAVRMAVGARARQVIGRFMGDGLRLSAIGLLVGLPLSLLGLRLLLAMPDFLPAVPVLAVAAMAAVGVGAVAAAATWIPARRAAGVEPATVLRGE